MIVFRKFVSERKEYEVKNVGTLFYKVLIQLGHWSQRIVANVEELKFRCRMKQNSVRVSDAE